MHSSFAALRSDCAMNVRVRVKPRPPAPVLEQGVGRIREILESGLARFGGRWLAGADFIAADAFFAPVAFRIRTYGLDEWGPGRNASTTSSPIRRCASGKAPHWPRPGARPAMKPTWQGRGDHGGLSHEVAGANAPAPHHVFRRSVSRSVRRSALRLGRSAPTGKSHPRPCARSGHRPRWCHRSAC